MNALVGRRQMKNRNNLKKEYHILYLSGQGAGYLARRSSLPVPTEKKCRLQDMFTISTLTALISPALYLSRQIYNPIDSLIP